LPVELRPIVEGPPDPMLEHLMGAIEAEVQAHCPSGTLLLESLGNTTALYLAQRYSACPLLLPADTACLSRDRMSRVDYVDAHLANKLSLIELASVACLSPYHFSKMFKRTAGQSVHRYVTARRIEAAKSLLKSGVIGLAEIASAVGFCDQSQLTVVFQRWLKETPGAYRRAVAEAHGALGARCAR
jgi:AraC family transcriptional regulator